MKKINWAILGAARITEKMIPAIINSKYGELKAIGSRRSNSAKECIKKHAPNYASEIECYKGFDQIINNNEIDAIYIPLSNEPSPNSSVETLVKVTSPSFTIVML